MEGQVLIHFAHVSQQELFYLLMHEKFGLIS